MPGSTSAGRCGGFRGRISFLGIRFLVGVQEVPGLVPTRVCGGGQEGPGQATAGSAGPGALACGPPKAKAVAVLRGGVT